jgi:hypothetical protein
VEDRIVKSFYRVTKSFPPTEEDYQTRLERDGPPPDHLPPEVKESWTPIQRLIHQKAQLRWLAGSSASGGTFLATTYLKVSGSRGSRRLSPGTMTFGATKRLSKDVWLGARKRSEPG